MSQLRLELERALLGLGPLLDFILQREVRDRELASSLFDSLLELSLMLLEVLDLLTNQYDGGRQD